MFVVWTVVAFAVYVGASLMQFHFFPCLWTFENGFTLNNHGFSASYPLFESARQFIISSAAFSRDGSSHSFVVLL